MLKQSEQSDVLRDELLVLPLVDSVLFPGATVPLFINAERAIQAVEAAHGADQRIVALTQCNSDELHPQPADLFGVGVEAVLQRLRRMPDGTLSVVLEGVQRVRISEFTRRSPTLWARVTPIPSLQDYTLNYEALTRTVLNLFERVVRLSRTLPDDAYISALNAQNGGRLADLIAGLLPLSVSDRQRILETSDVEERLQQVTQLLGRELDLLELENRIQSQVQQEVDRSQRELYLREQLRIIQRELGQDDPQRRELALLRDRAARADLPAAVLDRFNEEVARLELLSAASPEYGVIRTYLDWLLSLPWRVRPAAEIDLQAAGRVLDDHHYGLRKVKDRILEYLAVLRLAGGRRAPILCFVGPPGVGKTSLGRSIAEATGRAFVRLSLGGVHDEAEIRGHRRTYVGAMPGRILQRMKQAGTLNPVFLLDEVDKLGHDLRGDPAAALLEVLDPEQNSSFSDHYLDLAYDLSRTLFITTANSADEIPEPLLDRMEVIELPSYTEEEKLSIAQRFLIPRQLADNGLTDADLLLTDAAMRTVINRYTLEAGVRNLEREIGSICRKVARRMVEGRPFPRRVTPQSLAGLIGPARHEVTRIEPQDQIGLATGMAYTGAGGEIMPVEVLLMEGKGGLTLTGSLGEVMQESAQAALAFARANASALGLDARRFEKLDIHVHIPEGATPKEGPSAGITIAVALISALTRRSVRRDTALTGEITLTGRVLAIGGLKEKLLGAHRAGITRVIVPQRNAHELGEIPPRVRAALELHLVERLEAALDLVLNPPPPREKPRLRDIVGRTENRSRTEIAADHIEEQRAGWRDRPS